MNDTIQQKIIETLHLTSFIKEKQEEIITELGTRIFQLTLVKALEKMSDEEVVAFEKVLATSSQEEVQKFLLKVFPDLDVLVEEASKEVIKEYTKV